MLAQSFCFVKIRRIEFSFEPSNWFENFKREIRSKVQAVLEIFLRLGNFQVSNLLSEITWSGTRPIILKTNKCDQRPDNLVRGQKVRPYSDAFPQKPTYRNFGEKILKT